MPKSQRPTRPSSKDDIDTIFKEAHKFNGYERIGDSLGDLANSRLEEYEHTGSWRGTIIELRGCLFFEMRRWRHFGDAPTGESLEAIQALYNTIRERWHEVEPE